MMTQLVLCLMYVSFEVNLYARVKILRADSVFVFQVN